MKKRSALLLSIPISIILVSLLQGCATSQGRHALYKHLATEAGWNTYLLHTPRFDVAATSPPNHTGDTLIAYLEGDGRAYLDDWLPSTDPTPSDPVALRMALADPHRSSPVVYLARPCQYTIPEHGRNCEQSYWTTGRYSPAIIDGLNAALDQEKQYAHASRVFLIGYSGGGALAVLLAQRRTDVAGMMTVAANLDLAYWSKRDRLGVLEGSVDPATEASKMKDIPQLHMAGGKDKVVGIDIAQSFLRHMSQDAADRLLVIPDFDHICCWAKQWPALLQRPESRRVMQQAFPHNF